ncbi:GNAT family N-acetyltransferase [Burkholderia stagnalis]
MPIPWNAIAEPVTVAPPFARAERVVVRRFDPVFDSHAALTALLHRAFARLGEMGLNCTCVDQTEAVTRQRAEAGECFVAVLGARVIGTATLYDTEPGSACPLYRQAGVASVRQVAVDPDCQGRGIGALLLSFAEQWAASRGYALLALDTPHPASHLLAFYGAQGFDIAGVMRFTGKRYDSAILCKRPVAARVRRGPPASRQAVRRVVSAWRSRAVAAVWRERMVRRGARSAARHATGATAWRYSSRLRASPPPLRASRHAIAPSTPTATISAPHST